MKHKLDSAIRALKAAKEQASDKGLGRLEDKEKNRIAKRYDMKLQQEKQQMEMLHELELQRVKVELDGRLQIKKQRILLNQT